MEMLLLATFLSINIIFTKSDALPNHFVDEYTVSQGSIYKAYPIDVCVHVNLATNVFSKYTCNSAGDMVTKTNYGSDSTCADVSATGTPTTYNMTDKLYGAIHSGHCGGADNYVIAKTYKNNNICCNGEAKVSHRATGVCFTSDSSMQRWAMAECAANSNGEYNEYSDKYCNGTTVSEKIYSYDSCQLEGTFGTTSLYNRLQSCYYGGVIIQEIAASVCDDHVTTTTFVPYSSNNTSPHTTEANDVMVCRTGFVSLLCIAFAAVFQ